mgnify:CR=1 FL=1
MVFLHEVGRGAADRSYGVQVARLAGLPHAVVERAREVLAQYRHVRNVPPETLIETGMRAKDLQALGYTKQRIREDTYATDAQLSLLGFL